MAAVMVYCQNLDNGHPERAASRWGELHSSGRERQSRFHSRTFGPDEERAEKSEVGCPLRSGGCVQAHGTCGDPEQMMDGSGECRA